MKHPHRAGPLLTCSTLLALAAGCGVHRPAARPIAVAPPAAEVPQTPAQKRVERPVDGLQVAGAGVQGELDQGLVDEAFRHHMSDINQCYRDVVSRLWYLSGTIQVKLRVATDGQVGSAAVTRSSVGNYTVERCVLQVARKLSFPAPRGGEAEFLYPVELPVRAPVGNWPEDRVAAQILRHRGEIGSCKAAWRKGRGQSAMRMTMYIGPGGKVTSAGLSADSPIDEKVASCLVTRVQGWRFPDPLGQMVKASYAID